ncbi:alcohol dehydrogenase catalytic domain-containing protein [Methylocapsa sp. S129]|uniref:alcohol dehydrogenase catalytic domain-containing protein n=1 Tax=Methylocapsa sp. S129 TaxID=1641869 RepID=UPI001FED5FCE|nr:alcohol dehydrogenase catalytic domain-containing protein [Methylocapsa sp. S129]
MNDPTLTMNAARLHKFGDPMILERVARPVPRATDVLISVKACGVVPNLRNVLAHWQGWFPELPLPKLPAIFGLDVAGVVVEIGDRVQNFAPGDRVYSNPGLTCGSCPSCRADDSINCRNFTFRGYFGFGPQSQRQFDAYPHGGMCEFVASPQRNLVALPANLSFEAAARFGYLGTAFAALRKAEAGPGRTVLINGITGTLGLGACLIALAMGANKILGTARNAVLLRRVKALAPERIDVLELGGEATGEWARSRTRDLGVDAVIDCLGPGASGALLMQAIYALRRGGRAVNIGGVGEKVTMDVHWMMDEQISFIGSNWFTPAEGQALADMAEAGVLGLSVLEHRRFPLSQVNDALEGLPVRNGGFTNLVITPD